MAASTKRSVILLSRLFSPSLHFIGRKSTDYNLSWCHISRHYYSRGCSTSSAAITYSKLELNPDISETDDLQLVSQDKSISKLEGFDLLRGIGKTLVEQNKRSLLQPDQPENARILRVAIIGTPNAGKSTLTNCLMGWKVSSVSQKVHTTRKNTLAVHTEENTQVVFLDTPGILHPSQRKKHNLEKSLETDPAESLLQADMIGVMVDVSNTWNRNELDSRILHLLHLNEHLPTVLILNKVDRVKHKGVLLQIVRKLADGMCGGKPIETNSKKGSNKINLENLLEKYHEKSHDSLRHNEGNYDYCEEYENANLYSDDEDDVDNWSDRREPKISEKKISMFLKASKMNIGIYRDKRDEKRMLKSKSTEIEGDVRYRLVQLSVGLDPDIEAVIQKSMENQGTEENINLRDQTGWPNFSQIFMTSALNGDGVKELKDYFVTNAKAGDWNFHSSLVTDQNPQELAQSLIWEKILDYLPKEIPYNMFPRIIQWEMYDEDYLDIVVNIDVDNLRYYKHILGREGETIKKISYEAKQEVMSALRCDVKLRLQVKFHKDKR